MTLGRAKRTLLKYVGVRSLSDRLARTLRSSNFDREEDDLIHKHETIIQRIQRLERIARIEEKRYLNQREEEQAQIIKEYMELSQQYRDMMSDFMYYVVNPDRITDNRLDTLRLIHDLFGITDRYYKSTGEIREKYGELLDLIIEWSQKILLDRYLSTDEINKILNIALNESVDIYTYSKAFPELFKQSNLPADVFSEVMVFIAYGYCILNRVKLPKLEQVPATIVKYYRTGDIRALRDMYKYLMSISQVVYIPMIIANPDDILELNPENVSIVIEYSNNFISKGKRTRYQTMDTYDYKNWNTFIDTLTGMQSRYKDTGDIDLVGTEYFPDKVKGIDISNIIISVRRSD